MCTFNSWKNTKLHPLREVLHTQKLKSTRQDSIFHCHSITLMAYNTVIDLLFGSEKCQSVKCNSINDE